MKIYSLEKTVNEKKFNTKMMWNRVKKGKKGKTYCDSFSMELSVAIYQNNPSKVGKTIRPDSSYRETVGNQERHGLRSHC